MSVRSSTQPAGGSAFVVADRDEHVAGRIPTVSRPTLSAGCNWNCSFICADGVEHVCGGSPFGEREGGEETTEKIRPLTVATDLVKRLTMAVESKTIPTEAKPTGCCDHKEVKIRRHFPGAFTLIAVAQNQHGDGFENEAPDHAERVRLTEGIDVTQTDDDGEELESDDEVDDAIGGTLLFLRTTEPVGEHAVFGDTIEDAIGADDGGVDGAERMRNPTTTTKARKARRSTCGPTMCMASPAIRLSLYTRSADIVGDQHDRQQRDEAGEDEAVHANDDGGRLRFFASGCASSR